MKRKRKLTILFSLTIAVISWAGSKETLDTAQETLLWLKEKESFSLAGCRVATKKDVRTERNTRLGDVILQGTMTGREAPQEINLSQYVRLRLMETAADTLGSRLGRMGFALGDIPTTSCGVWNSLSGKK